MRYGFGINKIEENSEYRLYEVVIVMTKSNLEKKGFIWLTDPSQIKAEKSHGGTWRQEQK